MPEPGANTFGVPVYHVIGNTTVCDTDASGGGAAVMIGVTIGLVSSVAINIGQNLQALGNKTHERPCTSKLWLIGISTFAVGSLGNMAAMAFASATILVPLESSQFVTNLIFSRCVNSVAITCRQVVGTLLAVIGTAMICIFGPNDQQCYSVDDFRGFWLEWTWLTYVVASILASLVGWLLYARIKAHASRCAQPPAWAEPSLAALYALSSALIGGAQMIVHTKALAEMLDMAAAGQLTLGDLLQDPFFWLELSITAVCGIFWAVQMNNSLALYDQLFIIPLLQASYITFGATASGLFYREFETLATTGLAARSGFAYLTWPIFCGGVLLIIIGLMLLAPPTAFDGCCTAASADVAVVTAPSPIIYNHTRRDRSPRAFSERSPRASPGRASWVAQRARSAGAIELGEMQIETDELELDLSEFNELSPVMAEGHGDEVGGEGGHAAGHHNGRRTCLDLRKRFPVHGCSPWPPGGMGEVVVKLNEVLKSTTEQLAQTQARVAELESRLASNEQHTAAVAEVQAEMQAELERSSRLSQGSPHAVESISQGSPRAFDSPSDLVLRI